MMMTMARGYIPTKNKRLCQAKLIHIFPPLLQIRVEKYTGDKYSWEKAAFLTIILMNIKIKNKSVWRSYKIHALKILDYDYHLPG